MKIYWSKRSIADLRRITAYIQRDSPAAAARVASRIFDGVMSLAGPARGGVIGRIPGTYELMFKPWPYIVVYRLAGEHVRIVRVVHSAQQKPRS